MKESPSPEQPNWLDEHPKARWLATSRTTGLFSVAFVLLVIALVVVLIVHGRVSDDSPTAAPQTTTATPEPSASTQPDPGGSGFGVSIADPFGREIAVPLNPQGQILPQSDPGERPPFDKNTPVPAPLGVKWQKIGSTAAPFSTSDGPTRIEGRYATGYAHTPQGAALAGWQIFARMLRSGDDTREGYRNHAVGPPGVIDTMVAKLAASDDPNFTTNKLMFFPEAFRITSYTDDFAVIQYATPRGNNQWALFQQSTTWADGDWKITATEAKPVLPEISSLVGWTRW
ncbi:hypothetical protein BH93_27475 (plasmid) [Rhodococcoides fascians A25f]|uniref:hypothetical protein n=1 Tax=Rhodococcoides fascians TaxID=1828 RepID=UPI00055C2AA2|nr:hypothetical protein [Rhodococcus fascians]QII09313.1 hypothetical protein BH93_27475 [Rhodococcus fascians A25f]